MDAYWAFSLVETQAVGLVIDCLNLQGGEKEGALLTWISSLSTHIHKS